MVSIPILLGFYPKFAFEDNFESIPIDVVTEKYPDSCSYDMILHLEKNSNMASDAEDFGLSVNNRPENVNTESWHKCLIELDSMINKQNAELSEKINEVLAKPCEEMTIQPEWSEPDEYTRAYDVRFSICKPLNDILYDCKNEITSEKRRFTNNTHTINNTDCKWSIIKTQEKDITFDLTVHPGFDKNNLFKQKQLQEILDHCERQVLGLPVNYPYLQYENETHIITNDTCEWRKMHIRGNAGD